MAKPSLPQLSMEAINYQGRSLLLFDIVSALDALRLDKPDRYASHHALVANGDGSLENEYFWTHAVEQADLDRLKLSEIVEKRTHMRVQFLVDNETWDGDCYAEPPVLNPSNPYFKLLKDVGMSSSKEEALTRYQRAVRLASDSIGWVDLKTGTVQGVFAQMTCRVWLSPGLLLDPNYTTEEVAAVIIHELGHLFSFFETTAYTTASNIVISTAVDALSGIGDKAQKVKLISQATSVFGGAAADAIETIADESDPKIVQHLLLKTFEQAEQDRTRVMGATGHDVPYNTRSIEFLADQFAVRHGAALLLATAQHKRAKEIRRNDYGRSQVAFLAFQACRYALVASTFIIPPVGAVLTTAISLLMTYGAKQSDSISDPTERIGQMKSDLVQILKNTKLDPKYRKQVADDIDAIDALRAEIKTHEGMFRFIWRNIVPSGRRQSKIREFQKGLEDLVNNDLFIHANRLRSR